MPTSQVELIDLPTKSSVASTDYVVIDDGTTTYKMTVDVLLQSAKDYTDSQIQAAINASY